MQKAIFNVIHIAFSNTKEKIKEPKSSAEKRKSILSTKIECGINTGVKEHRCSRNSRVHLVYIPKHLDANFILSVTPLEYWHACLCRRV